VSDRYAVSRCPGPVDARARPPGSKSITNRALVCAALAEGTSSLSGTLASEDTQVMLAALEQLGIQHSGSLGDEELTICGNSGRFAEGNYFLDVSNSGTTMRFLAAVAALGTGAVHIDGAPRMRERPIQPLIDALCDIGVDGTCGSNGCPPVIIRGTGLPGGSTTIDGGASSQFLSAILMASPYAREDVFASAAGDTVSLPYLDMTVEVMKRFGVNVAMEGTTGYHVESGQVYQATSLDIEPDATAASYLWAIPAIMGGRLTVEGLNRESIQGDVMFLDCLSEMGCTVDYQSNGITVEGRARRGIDVDMNGISDTVQTLAVVALFVEGETSIRNVAHIRHKETDRIGSLARELRKLGADVIERDDGLAITPGSTHGAIVETYSDHRMAMSLALAGLRIDDVVISDPDCTGKTYPRFFQDLEAVTATGQSP